MPSQPETENLIETLDEDQRTRIAGDALEAFEDDEQARSGWMNKHAEWLKVYYQDQKPAKPPWPGASEESIPLLTEAVNQFQARAFQALFPSDEIIQIVPNETVDKESIERADRVTKHMQFQLTRQDRSYKANKDALLLNVPLHGSAFTKTFRDPVKKRNVVRNVRAVDLVVPYGIGPRDIDELERKSEIVWMTPSRTKFLAQNGFFAAEAIPFAMGDDRPTTQVQDRAQGLSQPSKHSRQDAKLIEQHVVTDIGDGVIAPYILTIDVGARKLLRVSPRWEIDPETGEEINKSWYDARSPVEYYTHYKFLPNPDGFYGLGMGHLLGQINTGINKLLRQTIDGGTLSTVGNMSGFISSALGAGKGQLSFELGQFKTINASGEDLARGIWTPNFAGPSPVIQQVISDLVNHGQRLSTVSEALTGSTEKVMQPTTVLALIEQGLQLFSNVYERLTESWTMELEKWYRLNSKFLDVIEYFSVLDASGTPQDEAVARGDYTMDMQISPRADPKQVTQRQKLLLAETEYNVGLQNPIIANNPESVRALTERFFRAIGSKNIDEILPPATPAPPPRIDDPSLENVAFMDPTQIPPDAFPDQDHEAHMFDHLSLLNNARFTENMPPDRVELLDKHVQKHNALQFAVEEQEEQGGEIGNSALAEQPGDAMGLTEVA